MITLSKLTSIILIAFIIGCNPKQDKKITNTTPLIPKDTTILNERNNKLFVFVGEKINITPIPSGPNDFDGGVKAKYLVLERIYGYYDKDTIEFEAFDHYGRFGFSDFKNSLLYISKDSIGFYQEKYMYDPLFKTKDGRWAGPYSDDYRHQYNEHTTVKT
jgi:hypothetical protein